jgi:hypothetical protein
MHWTHLYFIVNNIKLGYNSFTERRKIGVPPAHEAMEECSVLPAEKRSDAFFVYLISFFIFEAAR